MAWPSARGLAALAALLACGCAVALAILVMNALSSAVRARQLKRTAGTDALPAHLARVGVAPLHPLAELLLNEPRLSAACSCIAQAAALSFPACTPVAVCSIWLASALALLAAGFALAAPLAGALASALLLVAVHARCTAVLEDRSERMRQQLPDALRSLSACFHAGFTLQQTFGQMADELDQPLDACFARARDVLRTGGSLDEALQALQHAGGPRELAFVAVALQVQHMAGGSMQHVLDTAGDSLANELAMRQSVRVQTAQARLSSKVVVGVTVGLVAVLAILSKGFLDPFFASPFGAVLLAVAVAMQMAGIVLVRRMLDIEVE